MCDESVGGADKQRRKYDICDTSRLSQVEMADEVELALRRSDVV